MLAFLRAAEAVPHIDAIAFGVAVAIAASMFVAFAAFHASEQRSAA